jgi:hypothetical protein
MRSVMIYTPHQIYVGHQLKKNDMGGACGTYGGGERFVQDFGGDTWGKEITWKTLA